MKRVLVIDDDAEVRGLLCALLQEQGFDVTEAADGREGAQTFCRVRPDLVLCDIYMPEQDGVETIWGLRRFCPSVKIIAMSGAAFQGKVDMLTQARRVGADACLNKPFVTAELLQLIEQVLGTAASSV